MLQNQSEEQLRAALAAADRHMRLPYVTVSSKSAPVSPKEPS